MFEGLLQRCGQQWPVMGTGALAAEVLGGAYLHKSFLEVTRSLTIEPVDFRTGWPQAKQLTGREHSVTHINRQLD